MNQPTATDIQAWTKQPDLKAATPEEADRTVRRSVAAFKRFTGLDFSSVPDDLAPEVERAVQGLAELMTIQEGAEYVETLADFDLIQSFSAGNYSETRRSPEDAIKARRLVAWPWLNDLLWGLMTPDKHDEWLVFFDPDTVVPAMDVQEVGWAAERLPYRDSLIEGAPYHWWGA
jgi:hypothetical protein